ncbi:MAG: CTP-dependent riboflavin kinase [Candidatus Korarchaeota archaeon]|nr:CTP-dependent riboflavin kinase [Candidatus Korarchaeota archaeon]
MKGRQAARMVYFLISMARLGAVQAPVEVAKLRVEMGLPRTTLARWIAEARSQGLVEVRGEGRVKKVEFTKKGRELLKKLSEELQLAFEELESPVEITGVVFSGMGEGAYYVSRSGYKREFLRLLGYEPFPGTLNLRIASTRDLEAIRRWKVSSTPVMVPAFREGGRTFGAVRVYRVSIPGFQQPVHAIYAERRHYSDDVLELISPENLREVLKLKDGDPLVVRLEPQSNGD